uniref:Tetratricopeptide repeat domain 22 n=1 Tax=Esox lucius TaxID=8010 RepID=A0A3P8Z5Z6_ESOLU
MEEANNEEDIESLIAGMEYLPGHFHLDLNLNCEPRGPGELRRRDTQLKVDSLVAELEAEDGYLKYGVRNLLGLLAFHLDQLEKAEETFMSICKDDPLNLNAWTNLGYVYDRLQREVDAVECTEKVSQLMGLEAGEVGQVESRLSAARCLAEQAYAHPYDVDLDGEEDWRERLAAALTLYNRALAYGGELIPTAEKRSWYFKMATIYIRLDDIVKNKEDSEYSRLSNYNQGLKLLTKTLKSEKTYHKALAWCYIGIMLERKEEFPTVPMSVHDCGYSDSEPLGCYGTINVTTYVRDLERAKQGQGGLPDRHNLTEAKADLDMVLSVRPCLRTHLEMGQVYYYMGVDALQESLLVDEGALNRALVSLSQALQCDLGDSLPDLHLLRGRCLLLKGEEQNAANCFIRALELEKPGCRDTTALRCLLEALLRLFTQSGPDLVPAITQLEECVRRAQKMYPEDAVHGELRFLYRAHTAEVTDLSRALISQGRLELVRKLLETVQPKWPARKRPLAKSISM